MGIAAETAIQAWVSKMPRRNYKISQSRKDSNIKHHISLTGKAMIYINEHYAIFTFNY